MLENETPEEREDQIKRINEIIDKVYNAIEGTQSRDSINALLRIVCFNWIRQAPGGVDQLVKAVSLIYSSELKILQDQIKKQRENEK